MLYGQLSHALLHLELLPSNLIYSIAHKKYLLTVCTVHNGCLIRGMIKESMWMPLKSGNILVSAATAVRLTFLVWNVEVSFITHELLIEGISGEEGLDPWIPFFDVWPPIYNLPRISDKCTAKEYVLKRLLILVQWWSSGSRIFFIALNK